MNELEALSRQGRQDVTRIGFQNRRARIGGERGSIAGNNIASTIHRVVYVVWMKLLKLGRTGMCVRRALLVNLARWDVQV